MNKEEAFRIQVRKLYQALMLFFTLFVIAGGGIVYYMYNPDGLNFSSKSEDTIVAEPVEADEDRIENGIHIRTGLVDAEG